MIEIVISPTFSSWQSAARELLRNNVIPSEVIWRERNCAQDSLFAPKSTRQITRTADHQFSRSPEFRVPKRFLDIAHRVARHREPRKWPLLYSVLWRIVHQNHNLLAIQVDDEVSRMLRMHWEVGADAHRMKALLRFRRVQEEDEGEIYISWYVPDHYVVPLVAPHFVDKFAAMRWAILTPDCCAHWDGSLLNFSPGVDRSRAPHDDELEVLWRTFYRATFNPARLSLKTMRSEMPVRFWNNLPETEVIAEAVSLAPETTKKLISASNCSSKEEKAPER